MQLHWILLILKEKFTILNGIINFAVFKMKMIL